MSQKTHYEFNEHLMEVLDQVLGYAPDNIRQRIDARLAWLAVMPDKARAAYLHRTMYPCLWTSQKRSTARPMLSIPYSMIGRV